MSELKKLMLESPALTLAVAESLTCGQVQARVGAVSGASQFFLGGITAYTLDQKVTHLGVDRVGAKAVNAVSAEVAEQMARGACALFGSKLGIATTGYAEPSPAERVQNPFAWWSLVHLGPRGKTTAVRTGRVECPGATRLDAQAFVADAVITELVAYLREWRT